MELIRSPVRPFWVLMKHFRFTDSEVLTLSLTCQYSKTWRRIVNPPPVVIASLTGLQYVDRMSHHSIEQQHG
jgi:hypothetical protein